MARVADIRSRETLRLAAELEAAIPAIGRMGIALPLAVGLRELLTHSAFQATNPVLGDALDVELAAGWGGKRGVFVELAAAAGMIAKEPDGKFSLPSYQDALPSWGRKREQAKAKREALGKTISELRAEAGKKGGSARASKRQANGSGLSPEAKQTDALPSYLPSFPPADLPSDQPTDPLSEEPAGAGAAPEARKSPRTGIAGWYAAAWTERYGKAPSPQKHDLINAAKVLKAFPPEEQEAIVRAFVADEDPWLCERAHRLTHLPGQVDRIRAILAGTLSTGRPRARQIVQPSFRNEGLAGSAKYRDIPVRLVGSTPPSFRAEDEPPGTCKLDGIPVEILGEIPAPALEDEAFDRLAREFPRVGDRGTAAEAWAKLAPDVRSSALEALPGVLRVWRAATVDERRRVPELDRWLGSRFLADPEELEIEVLGNRRFVVMGPGPQPTEQLHAGGAR